MKFSICLFLHSAYFHNAFFYLWSFGPTSLQHHFAKSLLAKFSFFSISSKKNQSLDIDFAPFIQPASLSKFSSFHSTLFLLAYLIPSWAYFHSANDSIYLFSLIFNQPIFGSEIFTWSIFPWFCFIQLLSSPLNSDCYQNKYYIHQQSSWFRTMFIMIMIITSLWFV